MSEMDGGSIVVEVRADLARFDREMARARAQVADAESRRGAWTTTGRGRRDADAFLAETRALRQRADALQENVRAQERLAAADRRASLVARVGAVGLALNRAGANLQELSDNPGAWSSRAGGFLTNITSGNVVGAVKAAGAASELTADQIQKIGTSGEFSDKKIRELAAGLRTIGQAGAADDIQRIRSEFVAMQASAKAALKDVLTFKDASGNVITQPFGPPAARPAGPSIVETGPRTRKSGDLSLWRQRQTAIAAASPGTADDIREARKNIQAYQRMIKGGNLTDGEVTRAYQEMAAERSRLKSLQGSSSTNSAKKAAPVLPVEMELGIAKAELTTRISDNLAALKKAETYLEQRIKSEQNINQKLAQVRELGSIRAQLKALKPEGLLGTDAASVLGPLGGGGYLNSDRMDFAKSFGYQPKASDYIEDIRQQNKQASTFRNDVGRLGKLGGSQQLRDEIIGLGPMQGGQLASALVAGGRQAVTSYSGLVEDRQQIAQQTVSLQEMRIQTANITISNATISGKGGGTSTPIPVRQRKDPRYIDISDPNNRFILSKGH